MSGIVLPPIPTYAGDTRSLLGRKSQQGRDGSSLGRDLGHVTGRGQRTRFLFHLKKPDFVCRKCLEADTHGQGCCIMEKSSDRPVCHKISPACTEPSVSEKEAKLKFIDMKLHVSARLRSCLLCFMEEGMGIMLMTEFLEKLDVRYCLL